MLHAKEPPMENARIVRLEILHAHNRVHYTTDLLHTVQYCTVLQYSSSNRNKKAHIKLLDFEIKMNEY